MDKYGKTAAYLNLDGDKGESTILAQLTFDKVINHRSIPNE
jgi:hypothetical protein